MSKDHKPGKSELQRRQFLCNASAGAAAIIAATSLPQIARAQAAATAAPALVTSDKLRPQLSCGVMSGDITRDKAIIWNRTDRPVRMLLEYSNNEDFKNASNISGPLALPSTDYTARIDLSGLPAGQTYFLPRAFPM